MEPFNVILRTLVQAITMKVLLRAVTSGVLFWQCYSQGISFEYFPEFLVCG